MSCTAAVLSEAVDIAKVVEEIRDSSISERGAELMINVLKQPWKKETTRVFLKFA